MSKYTMSATFEVADDLAEHGYPSTISLEKNSGETVAGYVTLSAPDDSPIVVEVTADTDLYRFRVYRDTLERVQEGSAKEVDHDHGPTTHAPFAAAKTAARARRVRRILQQTRGQA